MIVVFLLEGLIVLKVFLNLFLSFVIFFGEDVVRYVIM